MAGDWIKMRTTLDTDPAVVRIASGLNTDRFAVIGRLHKIWAWASEHSIDGQDVPVGADFLDELVATPGFSAQLRSVGWLQGRDGSLCFPRFERHNGESAKQRALDAERKRLARKASEKRPDDNRTKTGLEERREEKRRKNKTNTNFARFEEWYSTYPRHTGKEAARKAYATAIKRIVMEQQCTDAEAESALIDWTKQRVASILQTEEKFRKHPASWLNAGCYMDEVERVESAVASSEDLKEWRP